MGSFYGHIDESIFMLLLGIWWMFNAFPRHIQSQFNGRQYECRFSYDVPMCCGNRKKRLPIEAILKFVFPVCAIIGELAVDGGLKFISDEGHFRKLVELQHISIFGLFALHGLIDLLMSYGIPIPRGFDYLSGVIAIWWFGLSLGFHAHMPGKEELEAMFHILPTYVLYVTGITALVELWKKESFLAQCGRIFGLLILGTWFTMMSFVLFRTDEFPGDKPNPKWDRDDMGNTHFIIAAFGYHCALVTTIMCAVYVGMYYFLKRRSNRSDIMYSKLEERQGLIPNGETIEMS